MKKEALVNKNVDKEDVDSIVYVVGHVICPIDVLYFLFLGPGRGDKGKTPWRQAQE